jgi:hypothetical protein
MRILLITNFFPPTDLIASHRTYSFAKYLPEFDIVVDVLTPDRPGSLLFDISSIVVHHPCKAPASAQFSKRSGFLKEILKYTGIRAFRFYLTSPFYHSAKTYTAHLDMAKYDAVLATYPAEDSLRVACFLSKRYDIPLIVDYRDLWLQNGYLQWTLMDKLLVKLLEGRINRRAALITTSTAGAAQKLEQRFGRKVVAIYNGFWDEANQPPLPNQSGSHEGPITLCYCGSLYGGKRPIEWVFPLMACDKNIRLKIAILEQIDADLVRHYSRNYKVSDQVELHIGLAPFDADELECSADVLILLNLPEPSGNDVIPAKFYQHLAKQRFILGIGHKDDEVGAILTGLSAGMYVSKKEEVLSFRSTFEQWDIAARSDISFFSRRKQAERLAQEIKRLF